METWISFFARQPDNGQKIYYFGEAVGVWKGRYQYSENHPVSPHTMICEERNEETDKILSEYGLDNLEMILDRMDAPWWMPYNGQPKPMKPEIDYPEDYPKT